MKKKTTKLQEKRARYYPAGTNKIHIKNTDVNLYLWQDDEKESFSVCGFYGRTQKPRLYIKTKTAEQREERIKSFIEQRREFLKITARNNKPHSLVLGDILYSSWGYEQTNVDFYQVTKICGKHMVEIREIEQEKHYGERDTGTCSPRPDRFKGLPMRRKANSTNYISVSSCQSANKWDGRPKSWSSYH